MPNQKAGGRSRAVMSGSKALIKKNAPKAPERIQPFRQKKKVANALMHKYEDHKPHGFAEGPIAAPSTYHGKPEKTAIKGKKKDTDEADVSAVEGRVRSMSIDKK